MQNLSLTFACFFVLSILIFSCVNHTLEPSITTPCDGVETISYSNTIKPLVTNKCAVPQCHNGTLGASLDWTNNNAFKAKAQEAKRRVQLPKSDPQHMPQSGDLSLEEIQLISCWADQGASIDN